MCVARERVAMARVCSKCSEALQVQWSAATGVVCVCGSWIYLNTLSRHNATHCNTLQRTATHCNTLQRTVTHCNTHHPHEMMMLFEHINQTFVCCQTCCYPYVCVFVFCKCVYVLHVQCSVAKAAVCSCGR